MIISDLAQTIINKLNNISDKIDNSSSNNNSSHGSICMTTPGVHTWTCPEGVGRVTVILIGGSGGGAGGGGGGGGYPKNGSHCGGSAGGGGGSGSSGERVAMDVVVTPG
jgi:hypothetical protein